MYYISVSLILRSLKRSYKPTRGIMLPIIHFPCNRLIDIECEIKTRVSRSWTNLDWRNVIITSVTFPPPSSHINNILGGAEKYIWRIVWIPRWVASLFRAYMVYSRTLFSFGVTVSTFLSYPPLICLSLLYLYYMSAPFKGYCIT